jgi:predicted RNA methylase
MIQMNKNWSALVAVALLSASSTVFGADVEMKPFILGSTSTAGDITAKATEVKKALTDNGFQVVGEYTPYAGADVIVATNDTLKKAGAENSRAGYIAAERVSVTKVGDELQVAYSNPPYMAAAYHVKADLSSVSNALKTALGRVKEYGPDEGKTAKQLADYHYTFGMEYFDEPYKLNSFDTHAEAVAAVEKGLAAHAGGTTKVYRIDIPGGKATLFGVGLHSEKNKYADDKYIMSEIDFKKIRSTPHLPYEMLVTGNKVEALHARFRIAMDFPDLSMMGSHSFMNIMPTPDAIKSALTAAAGGEVKSDF